MLASLPREGVCLGDQNKDDHILALVGWVLCSLLRRVALDGPYTSLTLHVHSRTSLVAPLASSALTSTAVASSRWAVPSPECWDHPYAVRSSIVSFCSLDYPSLLTSSIFTASVVEGFYHILALVGWVLCLLVRRVALDGPCASYTLHINSHTILKALSWVDALGLGERAGQSCLPL